MILVVIISNYSETKNAQKKGQGAHSRFEDSETKHNSSYSSLKHSKHGVDPNGTPMHSHSALMINPNDFSAATPKTCRRD